MLRLDLARLGRERSLSIDAALPADDPMWEGSGLTFHGPLQARLKARVAGSGEIVVRGRLTGRLGQECRRCLEPIEVAVDEDVTMVFAAVDEGDTEDDGEVRPLPGNALVLDLAEAVREELILTTDRFAVCSPDCKGLCPQCGVNWNLETCDCGAHEADPRWDALRALQSE